MHLIFLSFTSFVAYPHAFFTNVEDESKNDENQQPCNVGSPDVAGAVQTKRNYHLLEVQLRGCDVASFFLSLSNIGHDDAFLQQKQNLMNVY